MRRSTHSLLCVAVGLAAMGLAACRSPRPGAPAPPPKSPPMADVPSSEGPPNVVLIYADDLRADSLGATGHPFVDTPHLDRLAAEGAIFDNALVVTPLCCPSRASLLTGLYAHFSGVSVNGQDLDYDAVPYLPRLLQQAGYSTAFIGKYHLGFDGRPRPGFDRWVSYAGRGAGRYHDASFIVDGERTPAQPGFSTDVITDFAVEWIRSRGDRPFFLILAPKNPHIPYRPPPRHRGLYDDVTVPLPASVADPAPDIPEVYRSKGVEITMERYLKDPASLWRAYARMLPSLDDAVGRIVQTLQEQGILDRTFVIFTSDNGHQLGEHGLILKRTPYEPAVRVPLIVRFPPLVAAGQRLPQLALNVDLAPTILELTAASPPPGALDRSMQGSSLLPLLGGDAVLWRDAALLMDSYHPDSRPRFLVLREERWKYIRHLKDGVQEQLFDLAVDAGERHNRAGDPASAARLQGMRDRLRDAMQILEIPDSWWEPLP